VLPAVSTSYPSRSRDQRRLSADMVVVDDQDPGFKRAPFRHGI